MFLNRIDKLCSSLSGLGAGEAGRSLLGSRPGRAGLLPRLAAELRPEIGRSARRALIGGSLLASLFPASALCAGNGDSIVNRATFSSLQFPAVPTSVTVTLLSRTRSSVTFLKYAPGVEGATPLPVPQSSFLNGGGALTLAPVPQTAGSREEIDLSSPVPLLPYRTFHAGEPVFVRVADPDQNLDRGKAETILVTISDRSTGDSEVLQLTESGADTGIFLGYLQTSQATGSSNDGTLSVCEASPIEVHYTDSADGSDSSADAALVDPLGIVFDALTGRPIDGATVQLIDAATGQGATVLGDNGASGNSYPNTVVSGGTASDSEGRIYSFNPGGFRFPFVPPGNYILRVTPPAGYSSPSTATTASLQSLPGAPFAILEPGSRGEPFAVTAGPAIRVDIPLDPIIGTLRLRKSAGKSIVSPGEHLSYEITLENGDPAGTVFSTVVTDRLPPGFRYRKGSARLNGLPAADPAVSPDGGTLTFRVGDIGAQGTALIRYVVGVGAGAKSGPAVNSAAATATPAVTSNTASASVTVQEPFMQSRNIIMGRVFVGACGGDGAAESKKGMEGIGIYLEDGTFVVTDQRGMFHFEGVRSGSHVVQLDLDSIPEGYRILPCEENSRFAGRAYSQFVELQGGSLWRADFYLERVEPPTRLSPENGGAAAEPTGTPRPPATEAGKEGPSPPKPGPEGAGAAAEPVAPPPARAAGGARQEEGFKGEISLEMISSRDWDFVDYRIPLQAARVPLSNLRLTVTLPQGVIYQKGSSSLSGSSLPDPEISAGRLSYHLGPAGAQWQKELRFRVHMGKAPKGELRTRALLSFDAPTAQGISAPEVDNILSLVQEESLVSLPPVVLHPQFPTFGAELSAADREQLDELALTLSRFEIERLDVAGHTDAVRIAPRSRGIYPDNEALSFARAKSVGRYLAAALHLPPERVELAGRGEREPVAANGSESGRALNRRVEVKVSLVQRVETARLEMVKDRSGIKRVETDGGTFGPGSAAPSRLAWLQPRDGDTSLQVASDASRAVLPAVSAPAGYGQGDGGGQGARAEEGEAHKKSAAAALAANPGKTAAATNPKESERVELISALNEGIVHYRVKLVGVKEPLEKVTATLTTPEGILYMNDSSRLSGSAVADPEIKQSELRYSFTSPPDRGRFDLRLQALLDGEGGGGASSVTVVIAGADGKPLKSYSATAELSDDMEGINRPDLPAAAGVPVRKEEGEAENLNDYVEKVPQKGEGGGKESGAALHVAENEGFLSPVDGAVIASQVNAIRVVLNSTLTPVLTLDGAEIPAERIGFKMSDRESQKSLYTYIGADFGSSGEHLLQLKGVDGFGVTRFEKSARVTRAGEITSIRLVSAEGNVADGRTPVKIRIQLFDKEGKPVSADAELSLKGGDLRPWYGSGNMGRDVGSGMVPVDAQGWMTFQPVTASGLYRVQLAYNKATLDAETYVKPKMREWILVGLAEGTAGYNAASGHMENLKESGGEEDLYQNGRLAFYAKGTIKGEWLLTMAYDNAKRSTGVAGNGLFQNIDPNAFYTLYGDATVQEYDAASRQNLFLKVERDQFYALYGDYDTGLSVTELSRYSRRLNGVKAEFRNKDYEVAAFGSETGQSFVKDEIRGDGTSGLYRLSRKGIVANSESISIQSRDRFHSERITDSRPMTRFIDYSIDYEAGTIFFKGPVPSRDDNLDPVYIVIDYEVADAGTDALTFGGRAGATLLNGNLKVGGSYIHEGHVSGEGNLYGLDALLTLGPGTRARAEIATSDSDTSLLRASGSAYLAEITHSGSLFEGKAYFREQESGFGLGQQMGTESGTRKFGAEGAYKLSEQAALNAQAYRQYNLTGGAVRDFIETLGTYAYKDFGARAGVAYANDALEDGSNETSLLGTIGGSWKTLNQRLTLRADHEQALFSKNDNADYPTRTILGVDLQATKEVLLFAQEELTYGRAENTNTTRVGIKATPWSGGTVSTAVVNDLNENGERTFANVGLAQKWQLNPFWTVDGGLDRSQTIRKKGGYRFDADVPPASGGEDFTALSLGANYQEKKLVWSNRVEYRDGETEDKWGVITGIVNEQGLYWGWTGKLQYLHTRSADGVSRSDADVRLGLAYRPPVTRWIVLDRLDLVATDERSGGESTRGKRIINNLNANYRPDRRSQLSVQYGAKYVLEKLEDEEYSGFTDLVGMEGRYDLSKSWDIGLRGRMLHSWEMGQMSFSLGPSIGCNVMKNAWVSLGYNLTGFRDRDFSAADFTAQGPFVQFRFKFDQNSVKEGLDALNL